MEIVCSPELSRDDIAAIERGYATRAERISQALEAEVEDLLSNETLRSQTEILATLVGMGVLDIKVAFRTVGRGIFHEKIGILEDGTGDTVSFKGSSNETWYGWDPEGNLESIEVFASWRGGWDTERVTKHKSYLQRLWQDSIASLSVQPFPEAAKRRLLTVARPSLDDLEPRGRLRPPSRRADSLTPRPHQSEVLEAWLDAHRRGIVKHATGSGKTITAILAIKQHISSGRPVLLLVPTVLLQIQWREELRRLLPSAAVLLAGGGHARWEKPGQLEAFSIPLDSGERIVLATMATARTDRFLSGLHAGPELLVVADEVHRVGSRENQRLFAIGAGSRLGLSATPERFGDPDATSAILEYFGKILDPVITLRDAIDRQLLVEYQYFPHVIDLEPDEVAEWQKLTVRIASTFGASAGVGDGQSRLDPIKMLLIRRARIAKKAQGKIPAAVRILVETVMPDQRWLVYCEDLDQLTNLRHELGACGMESMVYYSERSAEDNQAALRWLGRRGGVILSVRCLDEGVDIPSVSHALIIASSQNPREFVQRRGRVLRKSEGKNVATIHDLLVLPPVPEDADPPQLKGLVMAEFARSALFARDALNRAGFSEVESAIVDRGYDPEELAQLGSETDEPGAEIDDR